MEPENIENEPPKEQLEVCTNSTSNGKGFRVKNVSEINASSLNETDENSNKRKLFAPNEETEECENECTKAKKANNNEDMQQKIEIKKEPSETSNTLEGATSQPTESVKIKVEPEPETEVAATAETPSCSNGNVSSPSESKVKVKVENTTRASCKFGIRCYRHTNGHRQEEAHPGDADYRRPAFPAAPPGTPACPYGLSCYRRNPTHFQEYSHPSENLYVPHIPQNLALLQNNVVRTIQQPQQQAHHDDDDDEEDETSDFEDDFDEPFSDDGDEYVPSDEENYTDDLSADYDDCDRVEE